MIGIAKAVGLFLVFQYIAFVCLVGPLVFFVFLFTPHDLRILVPGLLCLVPASFLIGGLAAAFVLKARN